MVEFLPSKQAVAGSNPVSRSTNPAEYYPPTPVLSFRANNKLATGTPPYYLFDGRRFGTSLKFVLAHHDEYDGGNTTGIKN